MMGLLAAALLAALSLSAIAAPFVVSDPLTAGVSQCGVYIDSDSKLTSPVVATMNGNICKFDLAGLAVGRHSISMTAIAVNDPVWGSQESAKSIPLSYQVTTPPALNVQGLWWNAAESGWGINFAHQEDRIFATWYTYDTTGRAWWLSMLAERTTPTSDTYAGAIYVDSGPPFNSFLGMGVPAAVGNGTLTFADANNGSFAYTVNTTMPPTTQTRTITRFDLGTGPQATCVYSTTTPNFAAAANYQDLWWVADGAESGWGVNFAHQGNSLFATWYTYNADHTPLWLSALVQRQGTGNVYSGPIYQNSGPRFDAYDTTKVVTNPVGTATFTFADGNNAMFAYTVMVAPLPGPVSQSKQITRFPFAATGGTVCQ